MTLLDDSVQNYLVEMNVFCINPLWNSYERRFIVGYHCECRSEKVYPEVRADLIDLFKLDSLDYSLSDFNPNYPTRQFIIYMNNKEEIKGKSNSDVSG